MSLRTSIVKAALGMALTLSVFAACGPVGGAVAAPTFGLRLSHSPTTMPRSDERLEYVAEVENATTDRLAHPGEPISCDPKSWTGTPTPSFSYQWLRDGVSLGAANGAQTSSYGVQSGDEGHSLQCQVQGTNTGASTLAVTAPIVVAPAPASVPPAPTNPAVASSRPTITGPAGASGSTQVCTAPTAWSGSPTWTFEWLRNGQPGGGTVTETTATTSKYQVAAGDVPGVLQCRATATNAGGSAVVISTNKNTSPAPTTPPSNAAAQTPLASTGNYVSGPVSLALELPAGEETRAFSALGIGWSCSAQEPSPVQHGSVLCTRSDPLAPGSSYPAVTAIAAVGPDAPDTLVAAATISAANTPSVGAEDEFTLEPGLSFGILEDSFSAAVSDELGNDYTKAGGHPFEAFTTFGFNVHKNVVDEVIPIGNVKDTVVDAPRGFVGNALSVPEFCETVEEVILALCPSNSAVGGIDIYTVIGSNAPSHNVYPGELVGSTERRPIFSLVPEFGRPAQFAFGIELGTVPYTFVPELRADEGYAVSFRTAPIITVPELWGTNVTLCNFGANLDPSIVPAEAHQFIDCRKAADANAYPRPLITNPTRCSGPPPSTGLRVDSWEHPEEVRTAAYTAPQITDCEDVEFKPEAELIPTNTEAESPTGLNVEIKMPLEGVLDPNGVSQANLDTARVTFPKGMSINPATADGLGACSLAQIKLHSNAPDECPESSKVGTVEIDTPLIRETLRGSVFVARQRENPFDATLGLYMAFDSKRDGVRIKVAGQLITDPVSGQLTSVFTESPEAPFSRLALKFNGGPRAALVNPPACGSYSIHSEFSPWSAANPANPTPAEIASQDSTYQVTSGPNGSPCPSNSLEARMNAGLDVPQAGAKSPFRLTLSREDGTQRLTGIDVATPKGLTAYLKGIPYCPEGTLAAISGEELTGAGELANPSCPAASQVGTVSAGAGSGPYPFQTPGRVYLAGPYRGAPVSLAVVTPAVAGPFDLGNVVIRNALYVDPVTTQVTAKSDPIPTILHGILLDIRQIRIALDRPGFTAAPTSCEPSAVNATVTGESGAVAPLANRFQVGGCEALGFKPKLNVRLFGGTHRGSHPRLVATVATREGDASISRAAVALPHSEFLEQSHIRTICTRVQFAARQCPLGSIYGEAEATTPLTDYTLTGPVYLRSSDNPLPDLVVALRGPDTQPIEVVLAGRIDSKHGGIRTSFEAVPDQPVSKFVLRMRGGRKGLLVNSRNICKSVNRVTARFAGQNGREASLRPVLRNSCKKPKKKQARKKSRHGGKRR